MNIDLNIGIIGRLLKKLVANKASGMDQILSKLLKLAGDAILPSLKLWIHRQYFSCDGNAIFVKSLATECAMLPTLLRQMSGNFSKLFRQNKRQKIASPSSRNQNLSQGSMPPDPPRWFIISPLSICQANICLCLFHCLNILKPFGHRDYNKYSKGSKNVFSCDL